MRLSSYRKNQGKMESNHPHMDQLIWGHFGEDFDIWGHTVPKIVSQYLATGSRERRIELVREIDQFMDSNKSDLQNRL